MSRWLSRIRFRFVTWAFADVIQEHITDAIHPEFGWIWQKDDYADYLSQCATKAYLRTIIKELDAL
jgi:hypothetical protein